MTFQQDRSRGGGGAGRCSAVHNNPQSTVLQSCKREIKMWITAVLAGAGLAAAAAWVGPDPLRLGSVPAAHLLAKYVMEQLNAAARRKIFLIF